MARVLRTSSGGEMQSGGTETRLDVLVAHLPGEARVLVDDLITLASELLASRVRLEPGCEPWKQVERTGAMLGQLGGSVGDVLSILGLLTARSLAEHAEGDSAVAVLGLGHELAIALLTGVRSVRSSGVTPVLSGEELASALLSGRQPTPHTTGYTVVAVYSGSAKGVGRLSTVVGGAELPGAVALFAAKAGYVFVPGNDPARAAGWAGLIRERLGDSSWTAYGWARGSDLADAAATAADVVALAASAGNPPGDYRLEDLVVEYAAWHEPLIRAKLALLIEPISRNPVLMETLGAFLEADGNRSKAADSLVVHRSTLDYRLQRIEQLTGRQATNPRDMQVLAVAFATYLAQAVRDALPRPGAAAQV